MLSTALPFLILLEYRMALRLLFPLFLVKCKSGCCWEFPSYQSNSLIFILSLFSSILLHCISLNWQSIDTNLTLFDRLTNQNLFFIRHCYHHCLIKFCKSANKQTLVRCRCSAFVPNTPYDICIRDNKRIYTIPCIYNLVLTSILTVLWRHNCILHHSIHHSFIYIHICVCVYDHTIYNILTLLQ